jgi:hypothetical protein
MWYSFIYLFLSDIFFIDTNDIYYDICIFIFIIVYMWLFMFYL